MEKSFPFIFKSNVLCIKSYLSRWINCFLKMWHPCFCRKNKYFIYSDFIYVLFIRDGNWGVTLVVSEQVGLSGQVVESVWCDSWKLSMLFVL